MIIELGEIRFRGLYGGVIKQKTRIKHETEKTVLMSISKNRGR